MRRTIFIIALIASMTAVAKAAHADDVAQGRRIYLHYCASCHGQTGEGNGPLAPSLTTPPANLRRLSEKYGYPLPEDQLARFIDGREAVKAHGPRDMPVWGKRFYPGADGSEQEIKDAISKLVKYLQSIQSGPPSA